MQARRPFVGGQKRILFVAPFLAPEIVQIFSFYVLKFWPACENRWQEGSLRQSQAVAGSRRQSQAVAGSLAGCVLWSSGVVLGLYWNRSGVVLVSL